MPKIPAYAVAIGAALFVIYSWLPALPTGGTLAIIPKEHMQIDMSVVLLAASLFVILWRGYAPKDKHWAYGTIGTLIGFWFHP
jgi:hypothetical protein